MPNLEEVVEHDQNFSVRNKKSQANGQFPAISGSASGDEQ
jgi:hypothetical protein